jgi:hypothetical protein
MKGLPTPIDFGPELLIAVLRGILAMLKNVQLTV